MELQSVGGLWQAACKKLKQAARRCPDLGIAVNDRVRGIRGIAWSEEVACCRRAKRLIGMFRLGCQVALLQRLWLWSVRIARDLVQWLRCHWQHLLSALVYEVLPEGISHCVALALPVSSSATTCIDTYIYIYVYISLLVTVSNKLSCGLRVNARVQTPATAWVVYAHMYVSMYVQFSCMQSRCAHVVDKRSTTVPALWLIFI